MIERVFDTRGIEAGGMGRVADRWGKLTASRLEFLAEVASLDRDRGFEYDGYTSAAAFLMHRCGMSARRARREVFLARSLEMRLVWSGVGAGKLSFDQAVVLASAWHRFPDEFARDEQALVDAVNGLTVGDTRRAVEHWCHLHAGPGDHDEEGEPSRLYLSESMGDRGRIDGDLDPETYRLVSEALGGLMSEIVRSTPTGELASGSVRRAEALKELARRHMDHGEAPSDHGNRPHISVVIDWDTLCGRGPNGRSEYLDGTFLRPEDARRLACDARVCRLVTGPDSEILDLGRSRRTVSPAQWRALRLRDRHCRFPGCRRPATWCDAHHIRSWWEHDGPTDLDNLLLLCRHHHTLIHRHGWKLTGTATDPTYTRPDGTTLPNAPP